MRGQVWKVISGFYDIYANRRVTRVRAAGRLRQQDVSPVVGDWVEFEPNGFLTSLYPRNNFLSRPKVANIDQVIIVTALVEPKFSSILLNKTLAILEHKNIKPIICFTKTDLTQLRVGKSYRDDGYEVYEISNKKEQSLDNLRLVFQNKRSVLMGQTGAGKSSTINNIAKLDLEVQPISKALGRGKHTTRVIETFPWMGGHLIDTPGFSALDFNLTKLELARSYHDFKALSTNCQFAKNCLHWHEKKCAVKRAIENGKLSKERYIDYLRLLKEI